MACILSLGCSTMKAIGRSQEAAAEVSNLRSLLQITQSHCHFMIIDSSSDVCVIIPINLQTDPLCG
jgi:hypothetical protein